MKKQRILIVDDKEENLYFLQALLQGHGYVVDRAYHGMAALELARQHPPALIVSDILMPVMDGFALCREWNKDPRLQSIPFVFYTATYTDERDREFGLSLGAAQFIIKPAEPEEFMATLQNVLRLAEHRLATPASAETAGPAATPAPAPTTLQDETTYLKQYNETLIRKLEDQMEKLERINREQEEDIARRQRTETALAERDVNLQAMLNALPESELLIDRQGMVIAANETACRRLQRHGTTTLIGMNAFDQLPADLRQTRMLHMEEVLRSKQPLRFEDERNGRLIDNYLQPILGADGEVARLAVIGFDITERRQAEERVLNLNRLLLTLSDVKQLIVHETDRGRLLHETCQILVSRACFKMAWVGLMDHDSGQVKPAASAGIDAGYTEKINVRWDDSPAGRGPTGTAIRTGEHVVLDDTQHDPKYTIWREQARARGYRSAAAFPIRIRDQVVGALNVYADTPGVIDGDNITLLDELAMDIGYALQALEDRATREQAEMNLKASEARFRTLVETAPETIFIEADGYFSYINQAGLQLFGAASPEELLGKPVLDRFHADCRDIVRDGIRRVQDEHQSISMVHDSCLKMDGTRIEVELSTAPFTYQNQAGALVFVRDITERQRAEAELRQHREHLEELVQRRTMELGEARDLAQAANRAKSTFLSNMSHELRTPLTAVLGFADLMSRDQTIPNQARDNLAIIIRSGEHLLALINDILDLSKIEAGRVEIERHAVDLGGLIRDVINMMRVRAEAKSLRLVLDQDSDFPRFINTDAGKFRQILVNLIGNAIKFTRVGQVTLRLTANPVPSGQILNIEVRDTGIGISQENIDRIFRPFEQVLTTMTEGTGLGLAITLQYVEMLGGKISVASELGKGTCFSFTLPVGQIHLDGDQPLPVPRHPVKISSPTTDLRLLIVEDQADNRLLLRYILNPLGFQLREAINGLEALAIAQEWHPHLIFMDRRMPGLDGLEATRRIKAMPGGDQAVIIAVSAHSFREEQQEMLEAGCNDFLGKPFDTDNLLFLLQKHLHLDLVYAEEKIPAAAAPRPLLPDDLQVLTPSALRTLYRLAVEGDDVELAKWLNRQENIPPTVKEALVKLINNYRFETIQEVVAPLVKET